METGYNILPGLEYLVNTGKKWRKGVTCSQTFNGDGSLFADGNHQYCHSNVNIAYRKLKGKSPFYIASAYTHNRHSPVLTKEESDALMDWMLDTPLGKLYIINRDDRELCKDGGILISGEASWTECLWICKVLRYAAEDPSSIKTWKALVDAGVDGTAAIWIASYYRLSDDRTYFYIHEVNGHVSVFYRYAQNNYKNIKAGFNLLTNWRYNKGDSVGDTTRLFPLEGKIAVTPPTTAQVEPDRPDGWGGVIKAVPINNKGTSFKTEDFIKCIKEAM